MAQLRFGKRFSRYDDDDGDRVSIEPIASKPNRRIRRKKKKKKKYGGVTTEHGSYFRKRRGRAYDAMLREAYEE